MVRVPWAAPREPSTTVSASASVHTKARCLRAPSCLSPALNVWTPLFLSEGFAFWVNALDWQMAVCTTASTNKNRHDGRADGSISLGFQTFLL